MSTRRKSVGKRLRFEVFKRDKFTCQYCGSKAPDVILQVDHIDPVASGGTNEIVNLITSCRDCNSGKFAIKLDDSSAIGKQRKQLELLQEKREQIELMCEWRKQLELIDADAVASAVELINKKLFPNSLTEQGIRPIRTYYKKYGLQKLFDAIEISADHYLVKADKETYSNFLRKIGGILVCGSKPEYYGKCSYVKGIARNKFSFYSAEKASIIISEYTQALKSKGLSDDSILRDIEDELIPMTKEVKNWSTWIAVIKQWIEDIGKWENSSGVES